MTSHEKINGEENSGLGPTDTRWDELIKSIKELKEGMQSLNVRQQTLENEVSRATFNSRASEHGAVGAHAHDHPYFTTSTQQARVPLGPLNSPSSESDASTDYVTVRNKHSSLKLPVELTLPDGGKTGIKRSDQPMLNVISKSAKHVETAFKVLKNADDTNTDETYTDLFTVLYSLMQHLQEEQAALVVNSTFDPTVGRFFRALQRGGSFTPAAIENLRSAASIAAVYRPSSSSTQRGRGNGGRGNGFFNQRGRGDLFHNASSRSFPGRNQRDNAEANAHNTHSTQQ